jgi:hypothetical protein
MRKYIEINEEVLKSIMEGKFVQGSLHYNEQAKRIDFNHYKRKERVKDKLIAAMEHGWLKESTENFKFFISLKKSIGIARVVAAMEREQRTACSHLMDREIVDRV